MCIRDRHRAVKEAEPNPGRFTQHVRRGSVPRSWNCLVHSRACHRSAHLCAVLCSRCAKTSLHPADDGWNGMDSAGYCRAINGSSTAAVQRTSRCRIWGYDVHSWNRPDDVCGPALLTHREPVGGLHARLVGVNISRWHAEPRNALLVPNYWCCLAKRRQSDAACCFGTALDGVRGSLHCLADSRAQYATNARTRPLA